MPCVNIIAEKGEAKHVDREEVLGFESRIYPAKKLSYGMRFFFSLSRMDLGV